MGKIWTNDKGHKFNVDRALFTQIQGQYNKTIFGATYINSNLVDLLPDLTNFYEVIA